MSTSAIVMMCIACIGLWGGGLLSLIIMFKKSGETAKAIAEEIKNAESEIHVDRD